MSDRVKIIASVILKAGIGVFLVAVIAAAGIIPLPWRTERRQQAERRSLAESAGRSIRELKTATFKGTVNVRLKYELNEYVSYILSFESGSGLQLGSGRGELTVEFLDVNGFSV